MKAKFSASDQPLPNIGSRNSYTKARTTVKVHPKETGGVVHIIDHLILNLFRASKIDASLRGEFIAAIRECVNVFERRSRFNSLGPYPERKFQPHKEHVIDFLTEVWRPWLQAEALTRPILRKQDPRAYTALANWLRKNDLPPDLKIPTRSEALDMEPPPADFESLKESAKRFHTAESRLNRARSRGQRRPAP